ncbi:MULTISPECIES: hypothetical protein [unclassified Phyllobacterium]|uniref:hypothetical protein n=1 Tax=unclassified Phyllobacterium TaxID=2638441 RepID=UPI0008802F2C|nr:MULTISPECIES: hypothetical protein [unclassified Phyllobacterium]MBA8899842.1 hypothetical protein [Phyllobacterium sp. P30BS-XVII]SDO63200.1 hypothetical protein SAMN05443582_102668 [Phyllobacterium sp. OV277]
MSQFALYLFRFTLIVFGFVCAIFAASLFLNLLLLGSSELIGSDGPFLYLTVPAFAVVIGYSVFIPAFILIVFAELTAWRDWLFYTLGGAATAVVVIVWKWRPQTEDIDTFAAILATGVVGGFVYWLVSGRSAGLVLPTRPSDPRA